MGGIRSDDFRNSQMGLVMRPAPRIFRSGPRPIVGCLILASALFVVAGCQDRGSHGATGEEAVTITNAQLTADTPQIDLGTFTIQTADMGDRWRVTYDIPGGSTGTPVIFDVDKKSRKIVYAHRNQ